MNPEQLRDAFEARAGQVEFGPDPLRAIRTRIDRRSRAPVPAQAGVPRRRGGRDRRRGRHRRGELPAGAPAAAAAADRHHRARRPPRRRPDPAPSVAVTVPVYWVGQQAGRSVLYREFRSATVRAGHAERADRGRGRARPVRSAAGPGLRDAVAGRRVGAVGECRQWSVHGGRLGRAAPSPIAVQQLVWTVTAVAADFNGTTLSGVRLTVNGVPQGGAADPGRRDRDPGRDLAALAAAGRDRALPGHRAAGRLGLRGGGPAAGARRGRRGRLRPAGAAVASARRRGARPRSR